MMLGFVCVSVCAPVHRAERRRASELSSEWCASAAPDASGAPSPAPAGAGWPAAAASPSTPTTHKQNTC